MKFDYFGGNLAQINYEDIEMYHSFSFFNAKLGFLQKPC